MFPPKRRSRRQALPALFLVACVASLLGWAEGAHAYKEAVGVRGILEALAGNGGAGHLPGERTALCLVDFAADEAPWGIGLGRFAAGRRVSRFVGLGATVDPLPPEEEGASPTLDDLQLLPWVGAGVRWSLGERASVDLETRWSPREVPDSAIPDDLGRLAASVSLSVPW